jgi:formiminoglutamase
LLARQFNTYAATFKSCLFIYGAAQLADGRKDDTTGKLISYLVSDFIKGMNER